MRLGGVLTALITPYDENGNVDLDALRRHMDRLQAAGVHGFFACGTTGEGAQLTREEKQQVISAVCKQVGEAAHVVAAVIQPDTRRAVAEARLHAEAGAPVIAVVAPYYIRVDPDELVAHFTSVADESPVPVVAYDIPGNTANPLNDAVYDRLLGHSNIIAVKDSSGDFPRFSRRVIDQKQNGNSEIDWIQGEDTLDGAALLLGASGVVSGLSNILPEPFVAMIEAARKRDVEQVAALQHVINTLHLIIRSTGKGVSPIRLALSQMGYGSRYLRTRNMSLGTEWDGPVQAAVKKAETLYRATTKG